MSGPVAGPGTGRLPVAESVDEQGGCTCWSLPPTLAVEPAYTVGALPASTLGSEVTVWTHESSMLQSPWSFLPLN